MSTDALLKFPAGLFGDCVRVFSVTTPLEPGAISEFVAAGFKLPASLEGAVISRKDEFMAGRYCAWRALKKESMLGSGEDKAPRWPSGKVGSIAHGHGIAVAAVARAAERASVGVDVERCMRLERAAVLRSRLLTPADENVVQGLRGWSEGEKVTLVFSAKETIYKCLHPLCGEYFGFHDAQLIQADARAGTFTFSLVRKLPGGFASGWTAAGRFALEGGWIFTALELPVRH